MKVNSLIEEYKKLEEDIFTFGRQIDAKIPAAGLRPRMLALIPEEKLVPDSLHFFHENICLNNICYIPESIALNLSDQTNAVTAQYALGGNQPSRILLIEYPDELVAKTAFEKFVQLYFHGQPIHADRQINIVKIAEEEYNAIALDRNFLILVFETQYSSLCKKLVAATLAKTKLYGRPIGQ